MNAANSPHRHLDEIIQHLRRYSDTGMAVAYIGHILGEAELRGYEAGIQERGRITADQKPARRPFFDAA